MEAEEFRMAEGGLDDMGIGMDTSHGDGEGTQDRLLIRQLLGGVDIANPSDARNEGERQLYGMAKNMVNFQYIVADKVTR
jgi:hypothetical protein